MENNYSYGIIAIFAACFLVCCTFFWNYIAGKKYRITFDQAEKIAIYLLAIFLVLVAIYTTYF